eukprot:6190026-Pleurochrysis_carterae.AAC.1
MNSRSCVTNWFSRSSIVQLKSSIRQKQGFIRRYFGRSRASACWAGPSVATSCTAPCPATYVLPFSVAPPVQSGGVW